MPNRSGLIHKKLAAILLEAQGFLETLGFEMKQVDLNFSTATREVIIKDIRVMREPTLAVQLDAAKMAFEALAAEKKEIILKTSREQTELKAELKELRGRLLAAAAAPQAPIDEPPAPAGNRGGAALQVEPDAVHKESAVIGEEGEVARLALASAEKELQKLREELGSVKTTLKSTMESLKNAKDEAKQAKKEQKLHKHESESAHETLKSEQAELNKARKETEGIRRELREARKVSDLHQAETADLKAEISRLTAELAGIDRTNSGETEVLRAALAGANASLSAEKAKNESALQEMDALEGNASAELKLLKKKVDSLTAEKLLLEKIATDIKNKAYGEIERQQQVNQSQRAAAIKKLQALKEEIRQLTEAREVIASPTGVPLVQSGTHAAPPPADDRKETSPVCQQGSFSSDLFGSGEATGSINFLPDKLLKGIPYSLSTDVVEIYRSYNTVHAAPNGKKVQKCDGFVCLVTEGGQSLVYVAWLMNSSGEVLICLPECDAVEGDSCQQVLREGIGYFERIGFVIDRFHLAADSAERQDQLDNLAVFCRTETECAA